MGSNSRSVAGLGVHSVKIFENFNLNDLPDQFFNAADTQTSVPNPFRGVLPGNTTLGQGDTIRIDRLRRQFPQFNDVIIIGVNTGRVRYHALQTSVQKRLSGGLQFVAHYTFSRAMQYTGGSLVNERHNNKSVAATDFPHIFRVFVTYDLPVGRRRALFGPDRFY
jgi:hypothetical protein